VYVNTSNHILNNQIAKRGDFTLAAVENPKKPLSDFK